MWRRVGIVHDPNNTICVKHGGDSVIAWVWHWVFIDDMTEEEEAAR